MDFEGLRAEGLACQRAGQIVVSGLCFEVRAGSALLLRGPNGSGKTTLLRTLAGFLEPAAGVVNFSLPGPADQSSAELASHLHYIGHANGMKPRLSVIENVSFWQRYYGGAGGIEEAEEALEAFGLLHLADYRAAHLSQGQARRLGLSRLLAADRAVWLLDEPSVSLDAASARQLETVISRHLSQGGLAIISAHGDFGLPDTDVLQLGSASAREALS
jgi:heme exporter protein A